MQFFKRFFSEENNVLRAEERVKVTPRQSLLQHNISLRIMESFGVR